jgi:phenylacetate-CoA ligase
MKSEVLYNRSPVFIQHIMTSLYGLLLHWQRYGGRNRQYTRQLDRTEFLSRDQLKDFQNRNLIQIVRHAYYKTRYYKELFNQSGIKIDEIVTVDDLQKLPILDKWVLKEHTRQFIANPPGEKKCLKIYTSGTTGSPLTVYYDLDSRRKNYAFFNRLRKWRKTKVGDRRATFYGRAIIPPARHGPPFWRYDIAENNYLFSSYHMTPKSLPQYYEKLFQIQPVEIRGYPSSLNMIAQYINENHFNGIRPKAVFTTAETLLDNFRENIETAFGCEVTDTYGCTEMGFYITQCEFGTYHAHPEYGIIETVNEAGAPVIGEPGQLVCTSFVNYAMPLIRYNVGDLITIKDQPCRCGRNFPVVWEIRGRIDDVIITPEGKNIGRLDPIFKGGLNIRETQIVQTAIDEIVLKIVPAMGYSDTDRRFLEEQLMSRIGSSVKFVFETVDEIPRDQRGKFRSVVSLIHPGNKPMLFRS